MAIVNLNGYAPMMTLKVGYDGYGVVGKAVTARRYEWAPT